MTSFKMTLCGKNINASVFYDSTVEFCSDYLSDFDVPDFSVEISPFDIVFCFCVLNMIPHFHFSVNRFHLLYE